MRNVSFVSVYLSLSLSSTSSLPQILSVLFFVFLFSCFISRVMKMQLNQISFFAPERRERTKVYFAREISVANSRVFFRLFFSFLYFLIFHSFVFIFLQVSFSFWALLSHFLALFLCFSLIRKLHSLYCLSQSDGRFSLALRPELICER